jgi:hypothetical protein
LVFLAKSLDILDDQVALAVDPALPKIPVAGKIESTQGIAVLVDIDADVDYCVHGDLHLHAVAAYG